MRSDSLLLTLCVLSVLPLSLVHAEDANEALKGAWSRTQYRDTPGDPDPSLPFIMVIEPTGKDTGSLKITMENEGKSFDCTYRLTEVATNEGTQPRITIEGRNPFYRNNITFGVTFNDDGTMQFESDLTSFRGKPFTRLHIFERHVIKEREESVAETIGKKLGSAWIDPLGHNVGKVNKLRTSGLLLARNADQKAFKVRFEPSLFWISGQDPDKHDVLIWVSPAEENVVFTPESSGQTPPKVDPVAARVQVLVGHMGSKPAQLFFDPHNPPVLTAPDLSHAACIKLVEFLTARGYALPSGNAQDLLDPKLHEALASEGTVPESSPIQRAFIDWYRAQNH